MLSIRLTLVLLTACLFAASASSAIAQKRKTVRGTPPRAAAAEMSPDAKRRHESFQQVWQVINDNYFDRTFNGLDWTAIKKEFEPRVLSATTDQETHTLLNEMINRLGRSHLAIIPPEVYLAIENAKLAARERKELSLSDGGEEGDESDFLDLDDPGARYGIGVELRLINDQFVVTRVNKNSAGEYAGLKLGYVIDKVNEFSLPELLTRLRVYHGHSNTVLRQLPNEIEEYFLNGEKDSVVDITYIDEKDQSKQVGIRREMLRGDIVFEGSKFPEQLLKFETAALRDDVAYVRFNLFAVQIIEKFCDALTQFSDKKALIIDLRGNSGGLISPLIGISGMLSDKDINLGTSIYRTSQDTQRVNAKAKHFKGRLVVLVDNLTASASEVLAVSLQEAGRALVVGETTAGAVLPSMFIDLPTGARLQYPIANYRSANGAYLEGAGVKPDVAIPVVRKTLLEGRDAALEKALEALMRDRPDVRKADGGEIKTITSSAPPPPPPPRPRQVTGAKDRSGPGLGSAIVVPPKRVVLPKRDAAAVKVIENFISEIGGRAALGELESYSLTGRAEVMSFGANSQVDAAIYKQGSSKYTEVLSSPLIGEVREVINGEKYVLQSSFGIFREMPVAVERPDKHILSPIFALLDIDEFPELNHQGIYERDGRKMNLIDGRSKNGSSIALAFDVESKMLSYYTGPFFGMVFGDYRKIGSIRLPYKIERENLMRMEVDQITINSGFDEMTFQKKIHCFDLPNESGITNAKKEY